MDLLAATTLDDASTATVQVDVRGNAPDGAQLRLVVQSWGDGASRPLGSVQRAVTARELRDGVRVRLVEVHRRGSSHLDPRVVAWVESGLPDLEFDGRTARPLPNSVSGTARGRSPRVVLRRTRQAA
jgi:hypothetical protein